MRLLFNKLKLTTTVEVDAHKVIDDAFLIGKKCTGRYQQLVEAGMIAEFIVFAQDLVRAYGNQGPAHRQRHVIAVGIPEFPGVIVKQRNLWDFFRGVVARVEIASDAPAIDEHLTLALMAKIAVSIGLRITDIDENDIEHLIHYLASHPDRPGPYTAVIRSFRPPKVEQQCSFGDIVRLRDENLAVGIHSPEELVDPQEIDKVVAELHHALLAGDSIMSKEDAKTLVTRFRKRLRHAASQSRLRVSGYGAIWPLEHSGPLGKNTSQRLYSLSMAISADAMTATICTPLECVGGCHDKTTPTFAELQEALQGSDITIISRETLKTLHSMITEKQNIVGFVVARGLESVAPSQPYLRIARLKELHAPIVAYELENPRDRLPKSFVHRDELVAVVEYAEGGRIGRNVYGRELPAIPPSADTFKAGPGVERRGREFFATVNGAIKTTADTISVEESLIIPGDVTPGVGDLVIPGSLVIKGGVDHGVSIDAQGSIKIGQSFAGRYLRAAGDLEIDGGIVGEDEKLIIVKGDLKVRFIQGGRVRCSGHVTIESHMSGGRVEADGDIKVLSQTGGIFGGLVVAGGSLQAANLGRKTGYAPEVWFGTSPKRWRLLRILEDRQRSLLLAKNALLRQGFTQPGASNERSARKNARAEANDRRLRIEGILERIAARIEKIKQFITEDASSENKNSQVAIVGITYPDVQVCQNDECVGVEVATEGNQFIVKNSKLILQSLPSEQTTDSPSSTDAVKNSQT